MIVNIIDYVHNRANSGDRHTVTLRFRTEPSDGKTYEEKQQALFANNLELFRVDAGDPMRPVKSGTGDFIIPIGNSIWTGKICGRDFGTADDSTFMQSISYGDWEFDQYNAKDDGVPECMRDVELEWEPSESADATARPPNNSQGNDPDKWFPEYSRSSRTVAKLRKRKFLGYIEAADYYDLSGPIHEGNTDLKNAGPTAKPIDKGKFLLPVNSAWQKPDPLLMTNTVEYLDTFVEYRSKYHDPAVTAELSDRQNVVNSLDMEIMVAVGGKNSPYPFAVRYPRGTARLESINVTSRLYTYRNPTTKQSVTIPFAMIRTQIAVSGDGHTDDIQNMGHVYVDAQGKEYNIRSEEGPILRPTALNQSGAKMAAGTEPGAMIWGQKESTFSAFLGNHKQESASLIKIYLDPSLP